MKHSLPSGRSAFAFDVVDAALPERFADPGRMTLEAQRAQLTVLLAVLLTALSGVFSVVYWTLDADILAYTTASGLFLAWIPILVLHRGASVETAGHSYVTLAFAVILVLNVFSGGTEPVMLAWFILPVLLSFMLVNSSGGVFWSAVTASTCLGLFALQSTEVVGFPDALPEDEPLFFLAASIALVVVTSGAFLMYGRLQHWLSGSIREREELQRALLGTAPDAIISVESDGEISAVNNAAGDIFGCPPDDLLDKQITALVPDIEPLSQTQGHPLEYIAQRVDGSTFPASVSIGVFRSNDVERYMLILRDISRRRDTEEELRVAQKRALAQSRESFRALIEASPDGIAVLRDGDVVYANRTLAELTGYGRDELLGMNSGHLVPHDSRERWRSLVSDPELHRDNTQQFEGELETESGSRRDVEIRTFVSSFEGELSIIARIRDITEQKMARAKMMHMDRMVAVGTLAAGVAHEINNPLGFVKANIDLLVAEAEKGAFDDWTPPPDTFLRPDELVEMLEDIAEGSDRIKHIVAALKTFSRESEPKVAEIDVPTVLESSIKIAQNEIRHRAQLEVDVESLPPVLGEKSSLGQVFLNLLINAAHAIPPGHAAENRIEVTGHAVDGEVVVEIRDTGNGIPPEAQTRIFDPFFSTKPQEEGMGLGLYVTRNIVRNLGGEISFESSYGEGTTFTVRIPAATGDLDGESEAVQASETQPARILAVDDEPKLLKVLDRMLSAHEVVGVTSGTAAIETLKSDESIDLIFCDLQMPDMSGMEFYEHLEGALSEYHDRVVFMTGGTFTPEARAFTEKLERPLVSKPFDSESLQDMVREVIGEQGQRS